MASSVTAIESFTLFRIIFTLFLSFVFLNDIPSIHKIIGSCIILFILFRFVKLEKIIKITRIKNTSLLDLLYSYKIYITIKYYWFFSKKILII